MTLPSIFETLINHTNSRPADTAVHFKGHPISRKELMVEINAYRSALEADWQGKKVALLLPTAPSTVALFIALLSIGCNVQVLNIEWPISLTKRTLSAVGSDLLICEKDACAKFSELKIKTLEELRAVVSAKNLKNGAPQQTPRYTCFTSGSTGEPKGCIRTELSWLHSFEADQSISGLTSSDTVFIIGSFAHSLFLYAAVRALYAGAKIIIFENFNPQRICQQIELWNSVVIFAVPTQIDALICAAKKGQAAPRSILSTGSKLSTELGMRASRVFENTEIIEFYGTSELSYVSAHKAAEAHLETFVGWPMKGVKVDIRDQMGKACSKNTPGFVFIESPMMFEGYIIDGKFSKYSGAFTAGDTGFIDGSGGLHLIGRGDRLFQSSGRNIIPEEIERALLMIKGIDQAAVLGIEDKKRGNRILAILQRSDPISRKEIRDLLKAILPVYAIPNIFLLCTHWPKTVSHKTNYLALKQLVSENKLEQL